jgi:hypothetical protein
MSALAPLGSFNAALSRSQLALGEQAPVSAEELNAYLIQFDHAAGLAEPALLERAPALGGVDRSPAPDHLRLPPPPIRAADGHALFTSLGRAVATFEAGAEQPIAADTAAVLAEARMMTLLRGIHGLEQEIRDRIARASRA